MHPEERRSVISDKHQIEAWIDDAKQGSSEALGQLLGQCHNYLARLAHHNVSQSIKTKFSASDLVQETSLDAHRDFAGFRGTSLEELLAWLRQILLYNAANVRRHYESTAKRQTSREISLASYDGVAASLTDDAPSPRTCLIAREEEDDLEQALGRLSDDHRAAILFRSRDHLSFAEIGTYLNRSADAARKLWFRAVERLHEELSSPRHD